MEIKWLKRLAFLVIVIVFTCCKNGRQGISENNNLIFKDPALKEITQRIDKDPQNAGLYYQRGSMLHRMKQDTLALTDFKKAISYDSTQAAYYSAVGDLLFEHKDISGSLKWLQKALELNKEDPAAHLKIAKLLIYTSDYPKAFSEINTVLRRDINNPEAYFLKGMIYKNIKDTGKAISSFQTAINNAPQYKDAFIQLGILYAAKKDPIALKYYDNAFKLDTLDVSPLYDRGMYYQNQGRYEEAKAEYKNCILHDPQYPDAYFNIGWILMQEDSLDKARRQYDLVTQIAPDNADAYYNRGLCSEMMGKKDDAIADYKQTLAFDKNYQKATEALKRLGAK
ncbi:MAG: tetratricopeptide repeat protein [Bacteroidetes bacterium]|nr:tetratricopeptide repeat protein [Bacteroidota bacterium]